MRRLLCKAMLAMSCVFVYFNVLIAETKGLHRTPLSVMTQQGDTISLYQQSHALLIGVSDYTNGWSDLGAIPSELDAVQAALEKKNFNVIRVNNPKGRGLKKAFEDFIDAYGYDEENRLLFFFSGHGHSDESNRHGFLVPSDAPLPSNKKDFRRSALDMNQIMAWSRNIDAKHALFLFDSCFSGTVFKAKNIPSESERYIRNVTGKPVRQFITAGSAGETVPAQSTFTPAFVDAIDKGAGDLNSDGYITGSELGMHLSQTIPRYVDQNPQYGKIRDYDLSQGDFVFFNKKAVVAATSPEPSIVSGGSASNNSLELAYWQSAEKAGTLAAYELYFRKYPKGIFVDLAQQQIFVLSNNLKPDTAKLELTKPSSGTVSFEKDLKICADHLEHTRLTTGKGGNALDCYNAILQVDSNNAQARSGLKLIESRYLKLAKGALSRGDREKALVYANRMARVNPASKELSVIRSRAEELETDEITTILTNKRRQSSTTKHYSN